MFFFVMFIAVDVVILTVIIFLVFVLEVCCSSSHLKLSVGFGLRCFLPIWVFSRSASVVNQDHRYL